MKKFATLVMILFVVIICTVSASAATVDSGMCGENVFWTFDDEVEMKIYGTGRMDDYTDANPAPWYLIREKIETAVIDEGVMNIGDNAFNSCENLASVSISVSVTNIGINAFLNCSSLVRGYYDWNCRDAGEKWGRIFIEAGNERLTSVETHRFTPYVGYVVSSERVYDADSDEYSLQMTLICQEGKITAKTAKNIKNFDSEPYDFTGMPGEIEKPRDFAARTFVKFTLNYAGEVERLDNRTVERISKCIRFNDDVAEEGLYLVNVVKERNGVLYFINADIEISGNSTAYENALANVISLNLYDGIYDYIG